MASVIDDKLFTKLNSRSCNILAVVIDKFFADDLGTPIGLVVVVNNVKFYDLNRLQNELLASPLATDSL